ncbi:hypothetical protein [uncultured Fibrella sp.]|uniref:hypothetical protein n=1 Tax=uncultured Fibrella sp. TaxID=1284596 RepID=UPI0035CA3502
MYPVYTLPVWLTDEQQLRDEAVLFGLSEARPDEKIATIRLAFAALTAPLEKQIEQHHEAVGTLNSLIDSLDSQLINQTTSSQKTVAGHWPVAELAVGLIASLLLCAGTYLGTLSLVNAQLAILLAGLTGISGCVLTLFIGFSAYRDRVKNEGLLRHRLDEERKQQLAMLAGWRNQKQAEIEQLYKAEATLNQQNAHRDLLIRLFESEFDLARSLRHRVRDRFVDL